MYACCSFTFGFPTYFAFNLRAFLFGGTEVVYLFRLLFDFDTSVNCYMVRSSAWLISICKAWDHKRLTLEGQGSTLLALSDCNPRPGCFILKLTIARCVTSKRLTVVGQRRLSLFLKKAIWRALHTIDWNLSFELIKSILGSSSLFCCVTIWHHLIVFIYLTRASLLTILPVVYHYVVYFYFIFLFLYFSVFCHRLSLIVIYYHQLSSGQLARLSR